MFAEAIKINVLGVFHGCQVALDFLIHGGVVVNVGSIVGLMPMSMAPVYTATKAAVIAYTRFSGNSVLPMPRSHYILSTF